MSMQEQRVSLVVAPPIRRSVALAVSTVAVFKLRNAYPRWPPSMSTYEYRVATRLPLDALDAPVPVRSSAVGRLASSAWFVRLR